MKFKLPQLHLLVNGDKKLLEEDPKKYIHVVNGHAIVNNGLICVVSLREYVKLECNITNELEIERLNGILQWMEGKSFTKDFWAELVKECFINLNGDNQLEIEYEKYDKLLVYEPVNSHKKLSLKSLSDNICSEDSSINRIGIDGKILSLLTKGLKNELKSDTIIMEFSGLYKAIKFTLSRRDYIFGLIPLDYDSASELTAFLGNQAFKEGLDDKLAEMKI